MSKQVCSVRFDLTTLATVAKAILAKGGSARTVSEIIQTALTSTEQSLKASDPSLAFDSETNALHYLQGLGLMRTQSERNRGLLTDVLEAEDLLQLPSASDAEFERLYNEIKHLGISREQFRESLLAAHDRGPAISAPDPSALKKTVVEEDCSIEAIKKNLSTIPDNVKGE